MSVRRVLVVNPPLLLEKDFIDYPFFAGLGALSNAAALRARGFSVQVADAQAMAMEGASRRTGPQILVGGDVARLLAGVSGRFDAVVVAISPFLKPQASTPHARTLFKELRARFPAALLLAADFYFGGMHYIEYDGEEFLGRHPELDALVKYEGETVLPDVLELPPGRMPRVVFGRAEAVRLDELPIPAWDLINVERYYDFLNGFFPAFGRPPLFARNLPTLPASTSRGCVYRCAFCTSNPGEARALFRAHRPAYLKRYFSALKIRFGARRLALLDSCPNNDPRRFREILKIIKRLGLKCEFPNGLRADKLTLEDLKMLQGLSESVTISAESADPEVLARHVKKGMSITAVERVAAWCRRLGFPLSIHYVVGMPDETLGSVNRTLLHALQMKEKFGAAPLLQNFVPIPGSALHRDCARRGLLEHFDAENLSRHFQGDPAVETPAFSRRQISRMTQLFSRRLESSALQKVIINLTYHCSNRCRFCAVGGRKKTHGDFKRYCGLLREYRKRGVEALDLDGGEPTLYPQLFALVRFAKKIGYRRITVTTNGRRLSDRTFASRLLLSGITDLLISLHGHNADIHEHHTRSPGSFKETLRGLRHAVRLKPERIALAVNIVVTEKNAPTASDFFRLINELGVKKVNVQFATPFGGAARARRGDISRILGGLAPAVTEWRKRLDIELVNANPCEISKHFPESIPEVGKHSREMVFVDSPPQNLASYLDGRRRKTAACRVCEYAVACAGFYVFGRRAP